MSPDDPSAETPDGPDPTARRTAREWLSLGAISALFLVPAVCCFVFARVDLDQFTIGWVVYALGAGILGCAVTVLERSSNVGAVLAGVGFWLALVGGAVFSFLEPDTTLLYYRRFNDSPDRGVSSMTTVYVGAVVMVALAVGGPLAYWWPFGARSTSPRGSRWRRAGRPAESLFDAEESNQPATRPNTPIPPSTQPPTQPPTHQERRRWGRHHR